MDEAEELSRIIDAQVERLLEDGNLKALQRLSVYAEAEATGNGLEVFEGRVAEMLFSVQRSIVRLSEGKAAIRPPEEIYGGSVSADLIVPPGDVGRVSIDSYQHPTIEPKRVLIQGGKGLRLMSVIVEGRPIIQSPNGFLLQSFGTRKGAPVDWPVFGHAGRELNMEFKNFGHHEESVHIEVHGHPCSPPTPPNYSVPGGFRVGAGGPRYG